MDQPITAPISLDSHCSLADRSDGPAVSERIVETVADADGTSPLELHPPLYSVVDPEALDRFVEGTGNSAGKSVTAIEFSYCGYEVTVSGDGIVSLSEEADH